MEKTFLIQRLEKPKGFVNPFSFGGGYARGGLSEKASDIIKDIWSFDYMGSAEFEFGALPEALQKIVEYRDEGNAKTGKLNLAKDVYYFCEKGIENEVRKTIEQLAEDEHKNLRLKEICFLDANLKGEEFAQRYVGWLELDNGFMFFVDKEMYDNSLKLFGINSD